MNQYDIKKQICDIGRRAYESGYVAANDGNISVKVNDQEIWITPSGVSKGYMTPNMLVKVNRYGEVLEGSEKVSSELKLHLKAYNERSDVQAVVHLHPPVATGFAVAGILINSRILSETILNLGEIPIADYGTPNTDELANSISSYIQRHDGILLANHGAITVGKDLYTAYHKIETIEFSARINLVAKLLGNESELTADKIDKLMSIRKKLGLPGRHPWSK
jgi:L-fuculose-phosphate aldolase